MNHAQRRAARRTHKRRAGFRDFTPTTRSNVPGPPVLADGTQTPEGFFLGFHRVGLRDRDARLLARVARSEVNRASDWLHRAWLVVFDHVDDSPILTPLGRDFLGACRERGTKAEAKPGETLPESHGWHDTRQLRRAAARRVQKVHDQNTGERAARKLARQRVEERERQHLDALRYEGRA